MLHKNKAHQIIRKTNISYPLIHTRTSAYQGVRNVCFSQNLACFVFFVTPVLRFTFLPYYRRFADETSMFNFILLSIPLENIRQNHGKNIWKKSTSGISLRQSKSSHCFLFLKVSFAFVPCTFASLVLSG